MTKSDEQVKAVVAEMFKLSVDELSGQKRLVQDLNIKSANRINLSVELEETFGIEINIFEVLKVQTLQELFDLVDSKVGG